MNIPLATLKPLLKKLSSIKADTIVLDTGNGILAAKEPNLEAYVVDESLKDKQENVYFFPAKKFLPVVNRMGGTLTVHKTDNGYSLSANKTRIEMERLEHPWKFDIDTSGGTQFKTSSLQAALKYTQIAVDAKQGTMTFSGLISLTGIEDFIEGSTIEAVATDGKRIAVAVESSPTTNVSVLLPASLVATIANFDGASTGLIDTEKTTVAYSGNMVAVANKFTNTFPRAKDLFPAKYDFHVAVSSSAFYEALNRIQPMVDDANRAIQVEIGQHITIQTIGIGGSGRDEVAYEKIVSELDGYNAMFDHRFLLDFFSLIKESKERVHVCGNKNQNYLVFKHENKSYLISKMTPGGK